MAHQPTADDVGDLSMSKFTNGALWFISLTAAISSHHTFKSTNFYKHYNLQQFNHETLIPIAIIILHAVFAFTTRVRYLIEMRGRDEPPWFVTYMETMLQLQGTLLMNMNVHLLSDDAMIMTAAMFSLFLMCFFRSVAPGFGRKLPFIPAVAAAWTAHEVSRLLEFLPFFVAFFTVTMLFREPDKHHVGHQKQPHSQTDS